MTFFAILAAILLEHFHPLPQPWSPKLARPLQYLAHHLNAGAHQHGIFAWVLAVLPVLLVTGAIYFALSAVSLWLAWLWNIAVLYLSIRFKSCTLAAESVNQALAENDMARAQNLYTAWRGGDPSPAVADDLLRASIEGLFSDALRHLLGVIFWFVLLAPLGPVGAVLYRLTDSIAGQWKTEALGEFAHFAQRMMHILDWLPTRITALSFAVAGDFEDAVYCWRSQAADWADHNQGILLASAAGALGVKLGMPLNLSRGEVWRPELGLGDDADSSYLNSAISLNWRVLTIWLLLLLLMALAKQAG
jgi:adenosylcobinamide-phosphate synthase